MKHHYKSELSQNHDGYADLAPPILARLYTTHGHTVSAYL